MCFVSVPLFRSRYKQKCLVCVAQLTHRKMPTSPGNTCDVKKWKDDGRGVSNPTLHSASSRHGRRKPLHKRWYVSRGQRKGCLKKDFSLSATWGWWKGQCKCHGACDKGGQRRPEKRVWWEMCASLCPQIQGEESIRKTPGAVLVSSWPQPQKGFAWNSMPWLIPRLALWACASGQHREPVQVKMNISCTLVERSGLRWWGKSDNMAASRDHQHTAASMSPFMAQRCHALPHGIQVGTAPRSVHPTPLSWPYPAPGLCHGSAKVGFKRGPGSSDVGINVSCPFWALRLAPVRTSRCLGLQGLCPASKNSEEQQRVTSSPNSQMLLQIC